MFRSKSRSGASDVGAKHRSSIVSRTLSSSKICRGDPLIDQNALVSIEKRPSAKIISSSSQNQLVRVSTMQRQMGRIEEELKLTKDQLDAAAEDRDRALDQLQDSKMMVHEANSRLSEALSPRKAEKLFAELTSVKDLLSNSQNDLAAKDKYIESIKLELDQAKLSENKLADQVSSLSKLDDELRIARISETRAMDLCAESRKRIVVLEAELAKQKPSESGMTQTKELEAAKVELEESRLQIVSLRDQLHKLQSLSEESSREQIGIKNSDQKSETSKAGGPQSEMDVLKKQLKAALVGEEQSTKAMNDLALALKEVATESNLTKEKLISTESELEHVKKEAEELKVMVVKYQKLLDEGKKETELHKNTADRLRLEAEDSYLAWNGKEKGFVDVIKQVEEEKACIQQEIVKLTESLEAAENTSRTAREENHKLRDVLKQALNEASVAKEAASIAQEENSELKDSLADKEETLEFLTRENDKLRISEAAANDKLRISEAAADEKIEELKRLLSEAHSELNTEDKDSGTTFMSPDSVFDDHKEDYNKQEDYSKQEAAAIKKGFSFDLHKKDHNKREVPAIKKGFSFDRHKKDHNKREDHHSKQEAPAIKKGFSFDLHKIKLHNKFEDEDNALGDEDPVKAEALKGSIFDPSTKTPRSEAHTPKKAPKHHLHHHHHHHHHHRKKSSLSNAETVNSDELDHPDGDSHHESEETHSEDSEADSQAHRRKKSVLMKNFGYLLMRKSFTQHTSHTTKESSIPSPDHE